MAIDSMDNNDKISDNEIILYQPDATVKLEVKIEDDTVWLTQSQMVVLFQTTKQNVSLHINNIFKEGELLQSSVVKYSLITASDGKSYKTKIYNLDVIISVGYRVKSLRGTQFRQWANKILKEYLLRGYSVNQRLLHMESRIDHHLSEHDRRLDELSDKVDFFVKTSLPPREGIVFDGKIFDAYVFVCDLVRLAKRRIILIDNYVDDKVLTLLDKRNPGVLASIFTGKISNSLKLDIERHNKQYRPINVTETIRKIHDRFMIIDDDLYHIGASVKDLGKKLFGFSKMDIEPSVILDIL